MTSNDQDENLSIWVHITAFEDEKSVSKALKCITEQSYALDLIRIVDNSPIPLDIDVSELQATIKRHPENIGTAGAINDSIKAALAQNITYLWLLDQDSEPNSTLLEQLIVKHQELATLQQKIGIIAPITRNRADLKINHPMRWDRYKPKKVSLGKSPIKAELIPAAGMLIHTPSIQKVDLPSERYFLDIYDFALGLSVKESGADVYIIPELELSHQVGEKALIRTKYGEAFVKVTPQERSRLLYRNMNFLTTRHSRGLYCLWGLMHQAYRAIKEARAQFLYSNDDRALRALAPIVGWLKGILSLGPTRRTIANIR